MNDLPIASVIGTNTFANESRIRDEMVHSNGGFTIPTLQSRADGAHCEAPKRIETIVFFRIPDVSHRRMAVANVYG